MSRIGKQPIKVPSSVTVTIEPKNILVNGPKGSLSQFMMPGLNINQQADELIVAPQNQERQTRAKHGLMRTLINNMVKGVSDGFSKKLEINGVGYRVNMAGSDLKFNVGFSHDVTYKIPVGVVATVDQNIITISGISKQQVGQTAAEIRAIKKPEPYKGKGIKYVNEQIIRKSGKSGKEK